jgi:uncharacterized membrane protein
MKQKNEFSVTWVDIAIGVLTVAIMAILVLAIVR